MAWFKRQKLIVKALVVIFVVGMAIWIWDNPRDAGHQIYRFFTEAVPAFADWLGEAGKGASGE